MTTVQRSHSAHRDGAFMADRYAVRMSRASMMGEGDGSHCVSRKPATKVDIRGTQIDTPGRRSSAAIAIRRCETELEAVQVYVARKIMIGTFFMYFHDMITPI